MSVVDGASDGSRSSAPVIETVQCGPRDRVEQAELFNACFKKRVEPAHLAWRYDENPHGGSVSFVSRTAAKAVCGYACSPRLALARGDLTTLAPVGETGDVMTHPEWRKRGLFSQLDRAAMEETRARGWPLVFGLPNRRSAHIFLELGWKQAGTVRPWTHVVRADAAARAERAKEGRVRGFLTPLAARVARKGRAALRARAGARFTTREIPAFPREVEALSLEVARGFELMVRRDAAYLDWRFQRGPSGLHRSFAVDEGERFAGYVVVQRPRAGERGGFLVDVLAKDDAALAAAVEAGLVALEHDGASFVGATAIDGSFWQRELVRAGFVAPKPENHLIVIVHPHDRSHALARAASDASRWYLTDGDRDDETMG